MALEGEKCRKRVGHAIKKDGSAHALQSRAGSDLPAEEHLPVLVFKLVNLDIVALAHG